MIKLILIGSGGHSKVVQDIIETNKKVKLYAIVDDAYDETSESEGIIYANTSFIDTLCVEDFYFCIAIGNNLIRKKIFEKLNISIERYIRLIHPSAIVSKTAKIGYGSVVMPNAVINADTTIGNHCIINTNAVVEHDNLLGNYVHLSPSVTLSGVVSVGEGTHVGASATVIQVKSIGSWSMVGAGAVVINDISNNVTAVGIPAKTKKDI